MDPSSISPWLVMAVAAASLAGTLWTLFTGPGRKAQGAVDGVTQRVTAIEGRIGTIEADIKHLPDREVTHRLELAMAEMKGRFDTIDARLAPVSAIAERLQDMIFEGKVK